MLRIKTSPLKKPAGDAIFESPTANQKLGIEMLIALNTSAKTVLTGPEVGVDAKILVTKEAPHFFYNPYVPDVVSLDDKDLERFIEDSIVTIRYNNYQGEEAVVTLKDDGGAIRLAINQLHNGIERANKKKV